MPTTLPNTLDLVARPAPDLLADRTVLVTGGSMGIGRACAEAVLSVSGNVVIAARSADVLARAAQELREAYGEMRVRGVSADVSREQDVQRLLAAVLEQYGRIDGVIHAAAVIGPIGPTLEVEPDEWWATLRVNLFGSYVLVRAAARVMKKQRLGRIVLLSGGGATGPFPNYTAYACSKVALVRLAESLALELEPYGIAINCLAPGFVATRLHQQTLAAGEKAGPEQLQRTRAQLEQGGIPPELSARAAVFLLSDLAKGITGKLLAAPWDTWWRWPDHLPELQRSDLFTLRRIVPRDRGKDWQ